jgi:hypothetical protein
VKRERALIRVILAPVFAATLFYGAAVMPGAAAAASGCHLETHSPYDQYGLVKTVYMVSFCTNPKTINYVAVSVYAKTFGAQNGVMVYDIYVTNATSACTRDTGYIIRHQFSSPGWQVPGGGVSSYTWNIYSQVNFGSLTNVCARYRPLPADVVTYSTTMPFYGYV